MAKLDDIYNSRLLELAASIPYTGHLSHPDARGEAHSKLCGSTVNVELNIDKGHITNFAQNVKACLLGQATASIVGRQIIGTSIEEVRLISDQMRKMLINMGPPPTGKWKDLALLIPVRDYRHRQPSTLLIFDALERAIESFILMDKKISPASETKT